MRLHRKSLTMGVLALCVSGIVAWSLFRPQSAPARPLDQLVPEGSMLYIEAKDFGALLKEWNSCSERLQWLKSDNYRVFSTSRLFLRLGEASDQFAAAAGLPPNMEFLTEAAGRESAVALYDIGNLEFLFLTRLSSATFLQSKLWQSRSKFQPRTAAGKQFYVRKDDASGRVVAFAVVDNYLILATREDLLAGTLELMGGSKGRSLQQEGWYAQAVAAAPKTAGELRMAMNLKKLAVTPHFRTYWVQQNITEMQSYSAAISDLYREGQVYREERIIFPEEPADESALAQSSQAVSSLLSVVPMNSGFYQVSMADARASVAALRQKILAPGASSFVDRKLAPQVQLTSGTAGSAADLETRIDVEPALRGAADDPGKALLEALGKATPKAMMVVQATAKTNDGVLLRIPTVVAIAGAGDWDLAGLERAAQQMLAPAMTASDLGLQWREVKDAGGYFELDGLNPVQIAVRGKIVYFANDAELLSTALQARNQPPSGPVTYAGAFSHARERENFYKLTSLLDQNARATEQEPQFFSQNIASFSRTFSNLESEEAITRQTKDRIQQTVTYRWIH
ncbi:MAG TPA: hypothetical protein VFR84_05590 [Candidatus Angelobacter sp.]|nr:hypothetical protein [Candidatus Angelobacter sp.]